MPCYFQGCSEPKTSMEHIPPKSFFPKDQRDQLLTVPSCDLHNGAKSRDDLYVLAHICLNSSPKNRSREIFIKTIVPQLDYNQDALRKMLTASSVPFPSGAVAYNVDVKRFDGFFTALSNGIVYKACSATLPSDYTVRHVYHNFGQKKKGLERKTEDMIRSFYVGKPMAALDFGQVKALNTSVYTVKLFGVPGFLSSITVVHEFFGRFRVTSMLTKENLFSKDFFSGLISGA
jgi:hypothetical protein